jgi:two-component system chemotaxis sensor kinase CheA
VDLQRELLAAFGAEYKEHVVALRDSFAALGRGEPADMKEVFRRAHTLKGAARAVDMLPVEEVAHRLETLCAALLDGTRTADPAVAGAVERVLDALESHVDTRLAGTATTDDDLAPAHTALDGLTGAARANAPIVIPTEPTAIPATPPEGAEQIMLMNVSAGQVEAVRETFATLTGEIGTQAAALAAWRDIAEDVENLRRVFGADHAQDQRALNLLRQQIAAFGREQRRAAFAIGQAQDRVSDAVKDLSLVPIGRIFGDFPRMVRDIARTEGTDVAWTQTGFDILADRRLLQTLKDPVLHLLRNAVGHGRETAEARKAAGKPEALHIGLTCGVVGSDIEIEVDDDGPGPDVARIETIARQRGLLASDETSPSTNRLLALVFEPGFSTAAAIDRLSGRGMGLSVVSEAVRRAGGTCVLRPRAPHGTRVTLHLPTPSLLQSIVLVEAGGAVFGLPSRNVRGVVRIAPKDLHRAGENVSAWIDVDGRARLLPVLSLGDLLGRRSETTEDAAPINVAVLTTNGQFMAIAVDGTRDAKPMLIEKIEALGGSTDLVAGASLLDDGEPVVILDPEGLRKRGTHSGRLRLAATTKARRQHTILVVDDSLTTRTLEKSILEANGYRVKLCLDGLDALETLRTGDVLVDLILADVEMPRLDGFGLLSAVRADARFAETPVIMMTSRAAPEDVRRGLELGANAYVTKQNFDGRELLTLIGQLL